MLLRYSLPEASEKAVRVEFFGDEIERISELDSVTGEILGYRNHLSVFPASHYATSKEKLERAIKSISEELEQRLAELRSADKLLEAQRLEQRTRYDLEMLDRDGLLFGDRKLFKAFKR
jgi:excinuclease ABC subunit B